MGLSPLDSSKHGHGTAIRLDDLPPVADLTSRYLCIDDVETKSGTVFGRIRRYGRRGTMIKRIGSERE